MNQFFHETGALVEKSEVSQLIKKFPLHVETEFSLTCLKHLCSAPYPENRLIQSMPSSFFYFPSTLRSCK
jgi:hypothetical protein